MELDVGHAVGGGVLARAGDQARIALDAHHLAGMASQRQGEVAQAAEQVEHALVRLRIEQLQGARDHALVEARVDLDEIERAEREVEPVPGQREVERGRRRMQRLHRLHPARLQQHREAAGDGEVAQAA